MHSSCAAAGTLMDQRKGRWGGEKGSMMCGKAEEGKWTRIQLNARTHEHTYMCVSRAALIQAIQLIYTLTSIWQE